jgi:4-diphosphocytidyl-2-C-methyl-D-erythritol kinase
VICFPNPKINLGLNIINKRADGFHNLETIFYPIQNITDVLEIQESSDNTLQVSGTELLIPKEENIVYKAYQLLQVAYKLPPINIYLHKAIPHGAGLGGGSSDAAHMLILLNNYFDLKISKEELLDHAAKLGSDCPFFIYNTPCFATGRGEILEPIALDLCKYKICLVQPLGIAINTAQAFKGIQPKSSLQMVKDVMAQPIAQWKNNLVNDFETTVFKVQPSLLDIKNKLYDAGSIYASMSGSGSCLYGIFEKEVDVKMEGTKVWWS